MSVNLRLEVIKRHPRIEEVYSLWKKDRNKNPEPELYDAGNRLLNELFPGLGRIYEKTGEMTLSNLGYKVFENWYYMIERCEHARP